MILQPRLRNFSLLQQRVRKLGARPIPVPGDGNCLIWSVQRLLLGDAAPDPNSPDGAVQMMEIRQGLKKKWLEFQHDEVWQSLFRMCSHGVLSHHPPTSACKADAMDVTPPRKKPAEIAGDPIDLITPPRSSSPTTPPRPSPPKKRRIEVQTHVGDARPANLFTPEVTSSSEHGLRLPGQNGKKPNFLEPQLLNVEEKFSELKMQIPNPKAEEKPKMQIPNPKDDDNPKMQSPNPKDDEKPKMQIPNPKADEKPGPSQKDPLADVDLAELDEATLAGVPAEEPEDPSNEQALVSLEGGQGRAKHVRSCRKRIPSTAELQKKRLKTFLARQGLSYGCFITLHKRRCELSKAAACKDGGFPAFREKLRIGKPLSCKSCLLWLDQKGLTMEMIQKVVKEGLEPCPDLDPPSVPEVPDPPQGVAEVEGCQKVAGEAEEEDGHDAGAARAADQYALCVEYVKRFAPHIELVEGDGNEKGYRFGYRCRLCVTRAQPEGKLNTLVQPKLLYVKRFLTQHIEGDTHQGKLSQFKESQAKNCEKPPEEVEKIPCPGLRVGDSTVGSLHHYAQEFSLWANFSKLDGRTVSNTFWWNRSEDAWFVRSGKCHQTIDQGLKRCNACAILAEPRAIQRKVVNFYSKYLAARLLNAKLFCTEKQVQEVVEQIKTSVLGQRHGKYCKKLLELPLLNLQKLVRTGFQHTDAEEMTPALQDFTQSIVAPCLRVNCTAINSKLPALSMQFANALANRDLTELESLNIAVADFAVMGRMDAEPLLQGLLVQFMQKLDRSERGVSERGRRKALSETARSLAADSAITISMLAGNRNLAKTLAQNTKPPPIVLEKLSERGLPNPMLALMSTAAEQLEENIQLIDQAFPRPPGASPCRLICAVDHTYLVKSFAQATWKGEAGLVGGFWTAMEEEAAWMPFSSLPEGATKMPKANLMLECLVWDPMTQTRRTFSCAEMPMKLKATLNTLTSEHPDRKAGNRDSWFPMVSKGFDFIGVTFHHASQISIL